MLLSEIDLNPGGRGSGPGIGVLAPIIRGIDREETKRKMKRRKEGARKGKETWREFGTVRYQAKAHTSASSANLIPLTMCTRRNLLTSPFLPRPHRFLVPRLYFSSVKDGQPWDEEGKLYTSTTDAQPLPLPWTYRFWIWTPLGPI